LLKQSFTGKKLKQVALGLIASLGKDNDIVTDMTNCKTDCTCGTHEISSRSPLVRFKTGSLEPQNLLTFFLIAFGWSWISWYVSETLELPPGIGTPQVDIWNAGPVILFLFLMPFGPTIAAFLVTGFTEGKAGVKALWNRFWNFRIGWRWWLAVILVPVILQGIPHLLLRMFENFHLSTYYFRNPWQIVPMLIFSVIVGGLSEEFGWRGYALPRLQARWDALTSSLILGAIWALWHLPLWFIGPSIRHTPILPWVTAHILLSVFYTWIFNNTNGNILAVVLFHAWSDKVPEIFQATYHPYYWIVQILAIAIILAIFGYRRMIRSPREQSNPFAMKLSKGRP